MSSSKPGKVSYPVGWIFLKDYGRVREVVPNLNIKLKLGYFQFVGYAELRTDRQNMREFKMCTSSEKHLNTKMHTSAGS